jgi:hypothetical protein
MSTRNLLGDDHLALKAAYRTLLKLAGGPVHASQEITRADPGRLSRYGNPSEPMFAPLDVIRDLEADLGEPIVTRALADQSGHVLVRKRPATKSVDFDQHLACIAKELSDLVSGIAQAKADGTITPSEVEAIRVQIREGYEALANCEADLDRAESVVPMSRKQL